MSTILAIDCSSDICSVALQHQGETSFLASDSARQHARETLPMVQRLLEQAQLRVAQIDAIAITRGPGSFTGLRIGTAVAQGLAFAHTLPVIPVSSLATMAIQAIPHLKDGKALIKVALWAREGEVYQASFRLGESIELLGLEQVSSVSQLAQDAESIEEPWVAVGNGWLDENLQGCAARAALLLPDITTHAMPLLTLARTAFAAGETVAAEDAQPVYLKEQEYRQA